MTEFNEKYEKNINWIKDQATRDLIQHYKEKYSEKIEKITIFLNNDLNEWQVLVEECTPGLVWVPRNIVTSEPKINAMLDNVHKTIEVSDKIFQSFKITN